MHRATVRAQDFAEAIRFALATKTAAERTPDTIQWRFAERHDGNWELLLTGINVKYPSEIRFEVVVPAEGKIFRDEHSWCYQIDQLSLREFLDQRLGEWVTITGSDIGNNGYADIRLAASEYGSEDRIIFAEARGVHHTLATASTFFSLAPDVEAIRLDAFEVAQQFRRLWQVADIGLRHQYNGVYVVCEPDRAMHAVRFVVSDGRVLVTVNERWPSVGLRPFKRQFPVWTAKLIIAAVDNFEPDGLWCTTSTLPGQHLVRCGPIVIYNPYQNLDYLNSSGIDTLVAPAERHSIHSDQRHGVIVETKMSTLIDWLKLHKPDDVTAYDFAVDSNGHLGIWFTAQDTTKPHLLLGKANTYPGWIDQQEPMVPILGRQVLTALQRFSKSRSRIKRVRIVLRRRHLPWSMEAVVEPVETKGIATEVTEWQSFASLSRRP